MNSEDKMDPAGDKGFPREISLLFRQYYGWVCSIIFRYVRDKELTEDLAQEVFLKFWKKRAHLDQVKSPKAYLSRMAVNEALSYLRKNRYFAREKEVGEEEGIAVANTDHALLHAELSERIQQVIAQLPPKCRTVFLLSRYEEMSYKEIAKQMDISVKTVENQIGKALRILRKSLKHYL